MADDRPAPSTGAKLIPPVAAVLARWAADEATLRRVGASAAADVLAYCQTELRATWDAYQLESISLQAAREESGMSYKGLQKAVAAGRVPNAGTKHRPRIRRQDVPRKGTAPHPALGPDLVGNILGLAEPPEPSQD